MEANETTKKYDFDRVIRIVMTIVVVGVLIFVVAYLSGVLLPFLVGCLLAYILNPCEEWLRRTLHLKQRALSSVLTIVLAFSLLGGVLWLLIPYLVDEFSSMISMLATYAKSSFKEPYIPAAVHDYIVQHLDVNYLSNLITKDQWVKILNRVASGTWTVVGGTMSVLLTIVSWIVVLLYMFFVLMDYDKISRSFKAAIPPKYRKLSFRVIEDVKLTMSHYFRGQALVSLCVGVIFAVEFYIIDLPMAIAFGLFIGLLNMVPYLQLVSIPIAAFLCLVASVATGGSFWVLFAWTVGAYLLCQAIQDLVLMPHIMKQQMGLNPAIIFLSLSIWGYILGFVGLIIALPLTTLIISYYSEYVLHVPNPLCAKKKPAAVKEPDGKA